MTSESGAATSGAPEMLDSFPGQQRVLKNLKTSVEASKLLGKPLEHVLLHGPPGLGKTTLAKILARELAVDFVLTAAPAIERVGDLAGILSSLSSGGVLFIDEIHRLKIQMEELLYSALDSFVIHITVGQGSTARVIDVPLEPFTLIGATTQLAKVSSPLYSRFGLVEQLSFYSHDDLVEILKQANLSMSFDIDEQGMLAIAERSRGTPRQALKLLRRIEDYAVVHRLKVLDEPTVIQGLSQFGYDHYGLGDAERGIVSALGRSPKGEPIGLKTLSMMISEDASTLECVYEPYLMYKGFLAKGPRGRFLTSRGLKLYQEICLGEGST